MSDKDVTPAQSDRDTAIQAVIDAVRPADPNYGQAGATRRSPAASYNSATGVHEYRTPEDARLAEEQAQGPIPDTGIDIPSAIETWNARLEAAAARINEVRFDPRTGQKTFVLQGDDRERAERAFAQLLESARFDFSRFDRLATQRERRDAERHGRMAEQAARAAFANGDANRSRELEAALLRAEADEAAQAIVRARKL